VLLVGLRLKGAESHLGGPTKVSNCHRLNPSRISLLTQAGEVANVVQGPNSGQRRGCISPKLSVLVAQSAQSKRRRGPRKPTIEVTPTQGSF
jgi:hypothetical protein